MSARPAQPPTTPPAMAPALLPDGQESDLESVVLSVFATVGVGVADEDGVPKQITSSLDFLSITGSKHIFSQEERNPHVI